MRPPLENPMRLVALVAFAALLSSACADRSWQAVQARDTVSSYSKFLRSNPESAHAEEARQRIEFLRVQTHKSIKSFEAFVRQYPESPWLGELRSQMEPLYFERARLDNSPQAYRAFLAAYPQGLLHSRAQGNLYYVEQVRPRITTDNLKRFIQDYGQSDFAAEARESLDLIELHKSTQIQKIGVRVEVAPNTTQPERVRKGFAAMVARQYREMGIEVVPIPRGEAESPDLDAWVRVDYEESQASGLFGGSTLVSRCRIRVYHRKSKDEPIWDQSFDAPAEHILQGSHNRDKTIFSNSRFAFWNHFFVPVSTWATAEARIGRLKYLEEVASVDVVGDRAALLFSRGGFDLLDVSRPGEPQVLARYRREHDLSRWSGIRIAPGDMVILYGPDGAEVVEQASVRPTAVGRWELPDIGSVRSAQIYEGTALLAGSRGVYAIRLKQRPFKPHRLLEGNFVGIELAKPYIYLIRPNRVEVTAPKHLLRHITGSRVGLGKNFGAIRARRLGKSLYVFGEHETLRLSLERPGRPSVQTRLAKDALGDIRDLAADQSHLYVLGDRGLQIASLDAEWVADSIQVGAGRQMTKKGQFLFLVGQRSLEVVDVGPYVVAPAAMVPAP